MISREIDPTLVAEAIREGRKLYVEVNPQTGMFKAELGQPSKHRTRADELERLRTAGANLLIALDACGPSIAEAFGSLQRTHGEYAGPSYHRELAALREALGMHHNQIATDGGERG